MAYILSIETSTTNCSVALAKNGQLIAMEEDDKKQYSHGEQLHLFIDKVIKQSDLKITDLNAIAISKGPGSYTGLRIGVSTAKGLCYALEIPLISISTLKILAKQVEQHQTQFPIIPMIDARRMEVYTSVFNSKFKTLSKVEAKILKSDSFQDYFDVNEKIYFIGNGVSKFKEICDNVKKGFFIENKNPSAKQMCKLADELFLNKNFEDVAYFEPYYLKDFVGG
ncbi:tRNA (adenosine(37)-N6)-threonylcarbamoyltransferase complex dimerization subunit type 1 TsaB [Flavobacterium sp. CS20]|uniref:tRNA (adenosine(37)-N6)-threonylcarbamoyltransferase complex dimerization subunit type 1 TsaB n=1 Tax=Flavobacterium sp. CS20 TaxID=2775246 RepID=UPI001B3A1930|nr:tRNA (adenosine(37)-N6)-threonylcarbamoyltransferase complex dimerization subunit type 1 TsaB [Flavobacterium sp. CS20]QTY26188.1 tRNA (adenosine(37)-N6)-threonylcarbamoyltransferase complex dimerization subunit type 1 TsaB [Flavobacterium sp. CS20]